MTVGLATHGYYSGARAPASSGATAPASSTTWAVIRNQMVKTVAALTPKSKSAVRFRLTAAEDGDFTGYAEDHDASVLREFEIVHDDTRHLPPRDSAVVMKETDCRFVMAYPEHWGAYDVSGFQDADQMYGNRGAMEAVLEQDADDIAEAIGIEGGANYQSGQHAAIESGWSTESGDGVTFLVIDITATYYSAGT